MKLFPKIFGICVVGVLLASFIAITATYYGVQMRTSQHMMAKLLELRSALAAAQTVHLQWLRTIEMAIINSQPELTIGIDGKLCDFGKWYYLTETQQFVATLPQNLQDSFKGLEEEHLDVHTLGHNLLEVWDHNDTASSVTILNEKIIPVATSLLDEIADVRSLASKAIAEADAHGNTLLKTQIILVWSVVGLGIVFLLFYSWLIAKEIVSPLRVGEKILQGIADEGNIKSEIPESLLKRKDEIGIIGRSVGKVLEDYRSIAGLTEALANYQWDVTVPTKSDEDTMNQDFNKMLEGINGTLHQIADVVTHVATGAGEVSNAAKSLSSGAQESAASLEEITASMSEISGQTKMNAESANNAHDLAQQATRAAVEGKEAMARMTGTMEKISKNSEEVQRVIKVIDDIAFQTNLLALNAAVEAARAGQHGKGFAVVAEEVRNLAARSAKAAHETAELIEKSGAEITKGDEVASHTAEILDAIVDQIAKTTEIVAKIATASNEQSHGVQQVTIGLQQIDTVTQQNSAAAEESANAATEMSNMTTNLQQLVNQFKLRERT